MYTFSNTCVYLINDSLIHCMYNMLLTNIAHDFPLTDKNICLCFKKMNAHKHQIDSLYNSRNDLNEKDLISFSFKVLHSIIHSLC